MGIKKVKNPKIVAPVKNVVNEHSNIGDNPSIIGLPNSNDVNNPINVDSQPMIGSKFPSFPTSWATSLEDRDNNNKSLST